MEFTFVYKCIVVTDMCGFTRSFLSDPTYSFINVIFAVREQIKDSIAELGQVISWIGDSSLLVFDDNEKAHQAILNIKANLIKHNLPEINYGMDCGRVVFIDNDIFGLPVNIASKLGEDIAKNGQYLREEKLCDGLNLIKTDDFCYCIINQ